MGTFIGHFAPGLAYLLFGLWWMTNMLVRRYRKYEYVNTATFRITFILGGRTRYLEIEGLVKLLYFLLATPAEFYTGFVDGKFVHIGNGQHITLYAFYGLSGVTDLLACYGAFVSQTAQYGGMALAGLVQGLILRFHLHGRAPLDTQLHVMLLYVTGALLTSLLLELCQRRSVSAGLLRAGCAMLHGLWLICIAFILFNPLPGAEAWDQEKHENIMIATMMLAWCILGTVVVSACAALLVRLCCGRKTNYSKRNGVDADYVPIKRTELTEGTLDEQETTLIDELP